MGKIINGNCLDILKEIKDNSVDLTITSPPYDNLRDYDGYNIDLDGIVKELYRVTKKGGVVVWIINDATINGSETGSSFKQALLFKNVGFNLHDTMIWQKNNFSNPSSNRYHQIFEYMFIFSKGKPKTFNPIKDRKNIYVGGNSVGIQTSRQKDGKMKEGKKRNVNQEFGMRYNIWKGNTSGQENMCKHIEHPATFPLWLVKDHIITWSNEGDLVLDIMCGSGTTCLGAKLLNRDYIGIDISQKYVEIAKARLQQAESNLL